MRMDKGAILASMAIIMVASLLAGAGTMAYFSDVETAHIGPVYAATLDMQIYDGSAYTDDTIIIHPDSPLAPGDTFTIDVWLKNVGTTDIRYVFASFRNLKHGGGGFADAEWPEPWGEGLHLVKMIVLDEIYEKSSSLVGGELYNDFTGDMDGWLDFWGVPDAEQDGSISLYDLAVYCEPGGDSALTSFRLHAGDQGDIPRHLRYCYLPVGEKVNIKFTFRLDENTKNYAQSDWFSFNLVFIGSNLLTPDESLTK